MQHAIQLENINENPEQNSLEPTAVANNADQLNLLSDLPSEQVKHLKLFEHYTRQYFKYGRAWTR